MSKRGIPRQASIASFLKPKTDKPDIPDCQDESPISNPAEELCPSCKMDASGSHHQCFVCNRKGHTFCCNLITPIEGFGKPFLCADCFSKNK